MGFARVYLPAFSNNDSALHSQVFDDSHVGMVFDQCVERVTASRPFHACGMPDAYDPLPATGQAFKQIIDGRVASRTGEHLVTEPVGLANERHDRSAFPGSRRAVDDRNVLGGRRKLNRFLLRGVQLVDVG